VGFVFCAKFSVALEHFRMFQLVLKVEFEILHATLISFKYCTGVSVILNKISFI
jgi:hypothetical protein